VQEPVAAVEPRKEIHKADNTHYTIPISGTSKTLDNIFAFFYVFLISAKVDFVDRMLDIIAASNARRSCRSSPNLKLIILQKGK
jgi:hypothetical protein